MTSLWRAVYHKGQSLESFVTTKREMHCLWMKTAH
ncbi:hypothetical protein [Novosphingobium sp. B 225]|nr:hypothetical protein [Novosphingobium sp. B 225]